MFRSQSNIYPGAFSENSWRLKAPTEAKKLHRRSLKTLLITVHLKNSPAHFRSSPSEVFLGKGNSENMLKIYRRTPMRKCDFNNAAQQLYWNHTSAWMFSCKCVVKQLHWNHTSTWVFSCTFAAYFQNTFSKENLGRAASVILWKPDNLALLYMVPENVLRNLLNIDWNIGIAVDVFSCSRNYKNPSWWIQLSLSDNPDIEIFAICRWDFYQLLFNWFIELLLCGLYYPLTNGCMKKDFRIFHFHVCNLLRLFSIYNLVEYKVCSGS